MIANYDSLEGASIPNRMLKSFDVWRKTGTHRLVRYRCFEDTEARKFCVQSADFYNLPLETEQLIALEKQFLELMIEESPFERSASFDSVEEAIGRHDLDFLET